MSKSSVSGGTGGGAGPTLAEIKAAVPTLAQIKAAVDAYSPIASVQRGSVTQTWVTGDGTSSHRSVTQTVTITEVNLGKSSVSLLTTAGSAVFSVYLRTSTSIHVVRNYAIAGNTQRTMPIRWEVIERA